MNEIKEFRGKYFFLSNFFETPLTTPPSKLGWVH